jgi:thymidylate synthase ThyX
VQLVYQIHHRTLEHLTSLRGVSHNQKHIKLATRTILTKFSKATPYLCSRFAMSP